MSELADSWHGMDDYPVVLGGGAHCGIRLGQYLHHAALTPYETMQIVPDAYMGIPHQRLLITVCQAMGLDTQALGVTGIRGWDGSTIDCTGSIPGLLA